MAHKHLLVTMKLSDETEQKLRERKYSHSQLKAVHKEIVEKYRTANENFKQAGSTVIAFIIGTVGMLVLMRGKVTDDMLRKIGLVLLVPIVLSLLYLLYLRIAVVNRIRNQFVKALHEGYPEYDNEMGKASFH